MENGKFLYKQSGKLLCKTEGPKDAKWIFVLSTLKTLYVGLKIKGTFQHSSFLAGGATLSAGRMVVEDGVLKVEQKLSGVFMIASRTSFFLCQCYFVIYSQGSFILTGSLASQWPLSPNRRKLPGIHVFPQGTQRRSN